MRLQLAPDLVLPHEAVTETFGLLAVRGAGKSNAAAVMAEQMFHAKLPFVAVDPVSGWWGLRSSRDGKGPGLSIPIFGGKRGDVPLERHGGQLVADLVVDRRLSCVLDLGDFDSEAAKKAFLLEFAVRLYRRNEAPLHLFLEEADDYIPQRPMRDEAHLLRAWENIVRRGRARGLGMTLITQRSAAINKSVLTQVGTLIAMRTTGPQDRAAIEAWLQYNDQSRDIIASLPSLKDGEAWVWSPRFLGATRRVRFNLRETFDSGATPKAMTQTRAAATLADVDLDAVKGAMAATIERAKSEDPRELRRQLAEARAEIAKLKAAPAPRANEKTREVPVLSGKDIKAVEAVLGRMERRADALDKAAAVLSVTATSYREVAGQLAAPARAIADALVRLRTGSSVAPPRPALPPAPAPRVAAPVPRRVPAAPGGESTRLPAGEAKVLTAVAQHQGGVTREQLTILTGYKRSTRDAYLQRLRERGHVEPAGEKVLATVEGIAALGERFEPLPTGDALREHWLARLPAGERAVLEVLVAAYPKAVDREQIDEASGFKRSTRDAYLQRLAARKLVFGEGRGQVRAAEELFG